MKSLLKLRFNRVSVRVRVRELGKQARWYNTKSANSTPIAPVLEVLRPTLLGLMSWTRKGWNPLQNPILHFGLGKHLHSKSVQVTE